MKKIFTKAAIILSSFLLFAFQANATDIFTENFGTPSATTAITSFTGWQNASPIAFSGTADVRSTGASTTYTGASGAGNVWLAYATEVKYIQIAGISTTGYSNLTLTFGALKAQALGAATMLSVQVSENGNVWTDLTIATGFPSAANAWSLVTCSGTIPASSSLYLKITNTQTATYQFRLDDIKISGSGAAIPTINPSKNSISGLTTIVGVTKKDSISISGSDLNEDIQLSIPTTGDGTAFTASASSVDKTGPTKVYVFFNPNAAGDYSSIMTLSSTSKSKEISLSGKAYAAEESGTWVEDFETGSKAAYAAAVVTCTKGDWNFDNALIGTVADDKKFGTQSARLKAQNSLIAMNADKANGAGVVKVYTSLYGTHIAEAKWILYISTNQGTDWTQVGDEQSTTNTNLAPITFTANQTGNVRFKLTKTSTDASNSLNIDNISITDYTATSVEDLSSSISVVSGKGSINVMLTEDAKIEIISIQGISQNVSGKGGVNNIPLASGLYIVKVGNSISKAIVK